MQNNELNNQLRNRLEDHESELDVLATWDAVESQLDKKKRRRGVFFWLFPLLLAGSLGAYWLLSTPDFPTIASTVATQKTTIELSQKERLEDCNELILPKKARLTETLTNVEARLTTRPVQTTTDWSATKSSNSQKSNYQLITANDQTIKSTVVIPDNTDPEPATAQLVTKVSSISLLEKFGHVPVSQLADNSLLLSKKKKRQQERSNKRFKKKRATSWSFEANQAISLPLRSTIIDDLESGLPQVSNNDKFEKNLDAFSTSLLIGFHHRSKFSLRTGLLYQRINTRLEVSTASAPEPIIDPNGVVAIRVDAAGDTTFTFGPVEVLQTTTQRNRYYNALTTFDVPLLLGYTFDLRKFQLQVEAGPVINLATSGNARIYTSTGQFRTVSSASQWFRNRLSGSSFMASANLSYPISKTGELTAGLRYFSYPKSGFETARAGYRTTYDLLGINVGYKIRF